MPAKKLKVIGVIPARYKSVRLPGKPLADINGKPMIQWVYEQAAKAKNLDDLIVATDDKKIFRAVLNFGGNVLMTSTRARSGTDRVAEVARKTRADIYVNIQGDEPMVAPENIDAVLTAFSDKTVNMSTVAAFSKDKVQAQQSSVVKVVLDQKGDAKYFSRSVIPHYRDPKDFKGYLFHCGLYAYRKSFLLKMASWPRTPLEAAESLEQLRVLENGYAIRVIPVKKSSIGVDTPADLEKVKEMLR